MSLLWLSNQKRISIFVKKKTQISLLLSISGGGGRMKAELSLKNISDFKESRVQSSSNRILFLKGWSTTRACLQARVAAPNCYVMLLLPCGERQQRPPLIPCHITALSGCFPHRWHRHFAGCTSIPSLCTYSTWHQPLVLPPWIFSSSAFPGHIRALQQIPT